MPLTDPVPSSAFDVLERNIQDTDKFVNQETGTFTNRVGKEIKPIPVIEAEANAAIASLGWDPAGEFAAGFTYTKLNDVGRDALGSWWRYNGSDLPKVIAAGTVPSSPSFSLISFENAYNVEWGSGKSVGYSLDDLQGFTDDLLAQAGIIDSGLPDTLGSSKRVSALKTIFNRSYQDVSAMVSDINHSLGNRYSTGGTSWEVVNVECGVPLSAGLWAEVTSKTVCANDFGADKSGIVKINDALNDALDVRNRELNSIPVSFMSGLYNIDGFTRRVQLPNTSIGQEIVTIVGTETPATAAHQFMVPSVIFEGNGDIFLSVVNYRLTNIGVRNRLLAGIPVSAGKLFTPYALGLEFGSLEGCYLGDCNYHIYYDRTPTPDPVIDYTLDMHFTRTCFFGARISSKYVNGYTAGYTETRCYTSNCQNGTRLTQPGPCAVIKDSKYEYINDFAIDMELYGYTNNYGIALENVFIETSGGGDNASLAGHTSVRRTIALPPIGLRTQVPNSSFCNFTWKNCHCTYTDTNKPIAYVYMPSERFTVTASANLFSYLPVGGHIYSKSLTAYISPWDLNILNSTPQGSVGYNVMNALLIGEAGDGAINAPLHVSTNSSQAAWFESPTGDTYQTFAGIGVGGRVGSDDTHGTYLQQGTKKVLGVSDAGAGNATLIQNGGGLRFKSPNGAVVKLLTIDNSGNPVWA